MRQRPVVLESRGTWNRAARRFKLKFRTETINLTTEFGITRNDESEAWMRVPIGTTEGFINDLQKWRGEYPEDDPVEAQRGQPKDPGGRHGNIMMLDRVVEWNLDDDAGHTLPLTKSITVDTESVKARAKADKISLDEAVFLEKVEIIKVLPLDLFLELANRMLNSKALTDRAEGFSKTSSE